MMTAPLCGSNRTWDGCARGRKRWQRLLFVALGLMLGARPALAQGDGQRLFVTGNVFASIELHSAAESDEDVLFAEDLSGTTWGGGFGVGVFLTPRWSAQVEFAIPGSLKAESERSSGFIPPIGEIKQRNEQEVRTRSASVLLGYHAPAGSRVRIGYLAGLGFVRERRHLTNELVLPTPLPPGIILPGPFFETTLETSGSAAVVGLDVDVAAGSRLTIVPQVRAQVSNGVISVRPGVAVRWTFGG
jgi:hypothetical protein